MDKRAHLQLRLQQTVEGLSVAAIPPLISSALSAILPLIHTIGVEIAPETLTGIAVPIVVLGVWLTVRRIRSKHSDEHVKQADRPHLGS